MSNTYKKPRPQPSVESAPYWDYCNRKELRLQQCLSCGQFVHYPCVLCPVDGSPNLDWVKVSGKGNIFSYTISHRAFHPGFVDDAPYVIAIIELAEGPRMMCRIRDVEPDDVSIGMAVEVFFEVVAPDLTLPFFKPAN